MGSGYGTEKAARALTRAIEAQALRGKGMTCEQAGAVLGVSAARARQLALVANNRRTAALRKSITRLVDLAYRCMALTPAGQVNPASPALKHKP